jgi:Ca2+-binding RTX toxin-like protein
MIINQLVALQIPVAQLSVQALFASFLRGPDLQIATNSTGALLTSVTDPDLQFQLYGFEFGTDGFGNPTGSIFAMDVRQRDGAFLDVAQVDFSAGTSLVDLTTAALAGTGAVNAVNFGEFYALLEPIPPGIFRFIGSTKGDVAEGFGSNDTIATGAGRDTIILSGGTDTLDGGNGRDTADGSNLLNAISVDLKAKTLEYDGETSSITKIECFEGTNFRDFFVGDRKDNCFNGNDGNDFLKGKAGDDRLTGGNGNDTIEGDIGKDILRGGFGNDSIEGGDQNDKIFGDSGGDFLSGGTSNDIIFGGNGNDDLFGRDGDDTLTGGRGKDTLFGENGSDILFGGAGLDMLFCSDGDDTATGGGGADTFVFFWSSTGEIDVITDFNARQDTIQFLLASQTENLTVTNDGKDTVIDFNTENLSGNGEIILLGVTLEVGDISFIF